MGAPTPGGQGVPDRSLKIFGLLGRLARTVLRCHRGGADDVASVFFVLPPAEGFGPGSGAVATVTRGLTEALTSRRVDVTVITSPRRPRYDSGRVRPFWTGRAVNAVLHRVSNRLEGDTRWDYPGYQVHLLGVLPTLLLGRPRSADLVVVHNDLQIVPILRALLPENRLYLWVHNEVQTKLARLSDAVIDADLVIAVSHHIRRWLIETHDLSPDKVVVIHNAVDLDRYSPGDPGPTDSPRVICHGRLDPHKGFHLVAEAILGLQASGVDVTMTLIGPKLVWGLPPAEAERYWDGLITSVRMGGGSYLGRVAPDDLPPILRAHEIACAPSVDGEAFGLSALEAMACGCAVILSDRGGLPELAGDAAIVVEPNADAIGEAMASVLRQPGELAHRRAAARLRAEQFGWDTAADLLLALRST